MPHTNSGLLTVFQNQNNVQRRRINRQHRRPGFERPNIREKLTTSIFDPFHTGCSEFLGGFQPVGVGSNPGISRSVA